MKGSRRLFEFECGSGHRSEHFVYPDVQETPCPECGNTAKRIISAVRSKLEGITGAFPGAADKWAKMHEEATRQAKRKSYYAPPGHDD